MFLDKLKTFLLLSILSFFLLLIGNMIGGHTGITIALVIAMTINCVMYFFSDKIVLRMYRAQPLDNSQYGWIYEIVHDLSQTMNIPMPKLWLIKSAMANAFATGRSPQHASVAVTTGILEILDHQELRGVLAHELSHIKNRDVLVATIAATLATAIGYLANVLHHVSFWSSVRGNRNEKRNDNPLVMLLLAIIMPIAASLIQLAISRQREYLADETGATACHDPLALASALEKLNNHVIFDHLNPSDATKTATASLFIVNPFRVETVMSWFSTHPPVRERVTRLRKMFEKRKY